MAQQSSFYNTDGTTRTYPSSKHIASKQHVAVYFQSVTTSTWSVIEQTLYDLVNNSIVFIDAPDSALYSQIEVRVADTAAELTESPSDIATVAGAIVDVTTVAGSIAEVETVSSNIALVTTVSGAIANVNTVATNVANVNTVATNIASVNTVATSIADVTSVADTIVPNIAEILLADTNAATATTQAGIATTKAGEASTSATNSQLRAWEAEAEKMTADSYATEPENVFVKIYTSNGDGTFTATNTTEYSALHWAAKSLASAQGDAINISYDNSVSGLTATNTQAAIDELSSEKANDIDVAKLISNQTFTGVNTFSKKLTVTDTSVSVTSGTYSAASNIVTVVLNVASHTVTVGDIIKVSGITNAQVATGGSNVQFNGYVRVTAQTETSVTYEIDTIIGTVASTALTGTVSFTNGGYYSDSMPKVKNGSVYYPVQPATAWVIFDGTTTPPTITGSFNISAVVRTSTGVYDVYFKDAMDAATYVAITDSNQVENFPTAYATNKFTFTTRNGASTLANSTFASVVIFGGRN